MGEGNWLQYSVECVERSGGFLSMGFVEGGGEVVCWELVRKI